MQGVMYYNPNLPHQVDHAQAFEACGFMASSALQKPADGVVAVISGPNYAYEACKHHDKVVMIDRAYWDDPNSVSVFWLQRDGTRKFASGTAPRPHPVPDPWKVRECSALILADYGQNISEVAYEASRRFTSLNTRLHPANCTNRHLVSLETQLRLHDVAIGHSGTALFTAIMQGVPSICTDRNNACAPVCAPTMDSPLFRGNRTKWLHAMSYKQFTLEEIQDGTAWHLLKDVQ